MGHLLRQRRREPEIMDQPDLSPQRHRQALYGLSRINLLSGSARSFFAPLVEVQRQLGTSKLRILDIACGGGDVSRRLWWRAVRAGLDWRISGCDLSPVAIEFARERALDEGALVHYFIHDLFDRPLSTPFDAVICSLFLHHLDEEQAAALLRALAELPDNGVQMILINDLDRSLTGLALAYVVPRLLTASPVVHVDAVRSVRAAYTPAEALQLAEQAGLTGVRIQRCWPARWLMSWSRS
jgi:2-polyprenyl-3-methyl-5-hydroxy-6-metoxy-1,4-benzoquinol methylase